MAEIGLPTICQPTPGSARHLPLWQTDSANRQGFANNTMCGISLPHVLNAEKWVDVGAGLHVCSEVDQSLFTCCSRCCFLFLFITWLEERLSTPALSKSSIITHWRTCALTLHTAVLSGTSYGVASAPFSCVLGSRSIPIYRAQGSVRRRSDSKMGRFDNT